MKRRYRDWEAPASTPGHIFVLGEGKIGVPEVRCFGIKTSCFQTKQAITHGVTACWIIKLI